MSFSQNMNVLIKPLWLIREIMAGASKRNFFPSIREDEIRFVSDLLTDTEVPTHFSSTRGSAK